MSHRDASLAALVLVSLVCPLSAQALSFSIDPLLSPLTVSNASLETSTTPPFLTDVLPAPGTDFARSVGGTLDADPITGVAMFGDLVLVGAPLVGDQMRFSTRLGDYRDIGDLVVTDLGLSFDALGNVSLSSGLATYDISQGSTRIVSIIPNDLSGDMSIFANIAGPPSVVDLGGTLLAAAPASRE